MELLDLTSIATFDEQALDQLHELQVEGEPSFVGSLISDYLLQVAELSEAIQKAESSGDKSAVEKAAHKLKSSSAVLGLAKLAAICSLIEETARRGEPTAFNVSLLSTATLEAISELRIYLATLN